jgi:acyl-[acyl carrier protein]--UDP-N-acetylglucosamine O-acyltransferase
MILANKDTIRVIGYPESTITQEAKFFISQEFCGTIEIISPEDFITSSFKELYSYVVAFTLDEELRQQVIDLLDTNQLDCIVYIHPTVVRYFDDTHVTECVGAGSFISPFSTMLLGSKIGKHCIVETYCLISHYVNIGDNTQLHSGTMIAGKTHIGKNCMFNFKSSVLNALTVGDNVELGAASCITKDTPTSGKYVGSPARRIGDRIKFNKGE